jgi:hypothetical protein
MPSISNRAADGSGRPTSPGGVVANIANLHSWPILFLLEKRIKMVEDSRYYQTIDFEYPNVAKKIRVFWGYPEFTKLMQELQTDSSDRPRAGFPGDVLFALHELQTIHDMAYPQHAFKDKSIWNV